MGILTDTDILRMIKSGKIIINPDIDFKTQIQPGSLELRLGNEFRVFNYNRQGIIDTKDFKTNLDNTELISVAEGDPFIIQPNELVLGTTYESIELPADLVGWIEGRSSYARIGIMIHVTAGFIHPGSAGKQTLEISNMSKLPVKLYPGTRICQIIFQTTESPASILYKNKKDAKYAYLSGPDASKIFMEKN